MSLAERTACTHVPRGGTTGRFEEQKRGQCDRSREQRGEGGGWGGGLQVGYRGGGARPCLAQGQGSRMLRVWGQ